VSGSLWGRCPDCRGMIRYGRQHICLTPERTWQWPLAVAFFAALVLVLAVMIAGLFGAWTPQINVTSDASFEQGAGLSPHPPAVDDPVSRPALTVGIPQGSGGVLLLGVAGHLPPELCGEKVTA
jgi:hypothetical protein